MKVNQLAAELVFLRDTEIRQLADYLVKMYPNTADRLEQDLSSAFQNRGTVVEPAEEVYSPFLGV